MPGVVTAIAAWMLDAACCAGIELGTPRAPHCRRLRIWMTSDSTAKCGEPVAANRISSRNTKMPDPQFRPQRYQRQLLISFEPPRLLGLPASERRRLVSNLATLLIEAAMMTTR
ncbi:hypothetical protein [Sinorhizobium meliloti]|nr:hypothetical protein U8C45_12810 [Sinorhizobium meliloti]